MISYLEFVLITSYMVITFHAVALKYRKSRGFHKLNLFSRTALVFIHFFIVITNIILFLWLISKDFYRAPDGVRAAGLLLFASGLFLIFWTVYILKNAVFIPNNKLIITGPFTYVRHPMYLGGCVGAFGLSVFAGSFLGVIYSIVLTLVLYRVSGFEEEELESRFGRNYIEYKAKTNRIIPRFYEVS